MKKSELRQIIREEIQKLNEKKNPVLTLIEKMMPIDVARFEFEGDEVSYELFNSDVSRKIKKDFKLRSKGEIDIKNAYEIINEALKKYGDNIRVGMNPEFEKSKHSKEIKK